MHNDNIIIIIIIIDIYECVRYVCCCPCTNPHLTVIASRRKVSYCKVCTREKEIEIHAHYNVSGSEAGSLDNSKTLEWRIETVIVSCLCIQKVLASNMSVVHTLVRSFDSATFCFGGMRNRAKASLCGLISSVVFHFLYFSRCVYGTQFSMKTQCYGTQIV